VNVLRVLLVLFATSIALSAGDPPIKVEMKELMRHSKKYDGKRVEVVGYWVTTCAHCSDVYVSFEAEQEQPFQRWLALWEFAPHVQMPKAFRKRIMKNHPDYDGYIRIVGTFEYRPFPPGVSEPVWNLVRMPLGPVHENLREPHYYASAQMERVVVTGSNCEPERKITAITEISPVGPELPSNIETYLRKENAKPYVPLALDRPQPVHH
jgi:hypothetical protein